MMALIARYRREHMRERECFVDTDGLDTRCESCRWADNYRIGYRLERLDRARRRKIAA